MNQWRPSNGAGYPFGQIWNLMIAGGPEETKVSAKWARLWLRTKSRGPKVIKYMEGCVNLEMSPQSLVATVKLDTGKTCPSKTYRNSRLPHPKNFEIIPINQNHPNSSKSPRLQYSSLSKFPFTIFRNHLEHIKISCMASLSCKIIKCGSIFSTKGIISKDKN